MEWLILPYKLLCFTVTIGTISWCLYNFVLNEDVSSIQFKEFQSQPEHVYPSVSFCVINPLLDEKLKEYGTDITVKSYQSFLKGLDWDDKMDAIDYDNVTLDLNDYILDYTVLYGNLTRSKVNFDTAGPDIGWKPPYTSHKDYRGKCFSIEIPYQRNQAIRNIRLNIKKEVFKNRARYTYKDWTKDNTRSIIVIYLNYVQQCIGTNIWKSNFPIRNSNPWRGYTMEFTIGNIEVVQRRNKVQQRCLNGFPNYDRDKVEWVIKTVGCRPPYWRSFTRQRTCNTTKELQDMVRLYKDARVKSPLDYVPCRSIETLQYNYAEYDHDDNKASSSVVTLKVVFQTQKFKEIKMVSSEVCSFVRY